MELDGDPVIVFFNGPCGDINPTYPNLIDLPETISGIINEQKARFEIPIGKYIEARMMNESTVTMKIREYCNLPPIIEANPELMKLVTYDPGLSILFISGNMERIAAEKLASELVRYILTDPMEPIELAALMGREIAKKAVSTIKKMEFKEFVEILCISTMMIAETEDAEQLEEFPFFRNSKSFIQPEQNNGKPGIEVEVNCMKFGNAILIGLPGEVTNEISIRLKSLLLNTKRISYAFCFELLNGEIGYILSPEDFNIGGYETLISIGPNNGFHMEQIIIDSASKLLGIPIPWKREVKIETRQIARVKNIKVQF